MKTPNLRPEIMSLELDYANKLLGMGFTGKDVKVLLEKMRYGVELDGDKIRVLVPAYRTDILHPIDLVEDIAIAYGYGNFKPEIPAGGTAGVKDVFEGFSSTLRELMLGFGFQEVLTLIMTNERDLFERAGIPAKPAVVTRNPVSLEHSIARTWLIPSLMAVLEKNRNREYPQRIFEAGDCINAKGEDNRKLSGVVAHSKTNFSEMKAIYAGILDNLGLGYDMKKFGYGSFIPGRCAFSEHGFFGEIHPQVLENFNLEVPVTAFELDLNLIFEGL